MSHTFFEQHLRMLLLPLAHSLIKTIHQFSGYYMAEKWALSIMDLESIHFNTNPTIISASTPLSPFSHVPETRCITPRTTNETIEETKPSPSYSTNNSIMIGTHSNTSSECSDDHVRLTSVPVFNCCDCIDANLCHNDHCHLFLVILGCRSILMDGVLFWNPENDFFGDLVWDHCIYIHLGQTSNDGRIKLDSLPHVHSPTHLTDPQFNQPSICLRLPPTHHDISLTIITDKLTLILWRTRYLTIIQLIIYPISFQHPSKLTRMQTNQIYYQNKLTTTRLRSNTSQINSSDLNDDGRNHMSDNFDPIHSVIKSLVYDLSQSIDLFHDMNKATYTMVLLNDLYKSNMNTRRFRSNDLNDVDRIFMSDTFDPVHVYDLSHNIDLPYDMTNTYQQPLLYLEDGNPGNTMLLYCSFVWFIQICYLKIYFYKLNVIISLYRLLKKKKKKKKNNVKANV
eukprot:24033_1